MSEATPTPRVHVWNGLTIPTAGTFVLDPAHANVGFTTKHLMVTTIRGRFDDVSATLALADDPADSVVEVTIGTASVTTGQDDHDERLRSDDFFAVTAYPTLTFRSTMLTHTGDNAFVLTGDLTIRDITRPVDMYASFDGVGVNPWGAQVLGFSSRTEIDRASWGLTLHPVLEVGGVLLGKTVVLEIDAEFNRV